jgi:hypothetical protein
MKQEVDSAEPGYDWAVTWPPRLKRALAQQKERAATADPPVAQLEPPGFVSVADVLTRCHNYLNVRFPSVEDRETTQFLLFFLLDLFECGCAAQLLTENEKAVLSKKARKKKKRDEQTLVPEMSYAPVVPVDYLLRLLATLPRVLQHYSALYGGVGPAAYHGLADRVNALLEFIDENAPPKA